MSISVQIVTPERPIYSGTCSEVRAPSALGEIGVMPGHRALLAALDAGRVLVQAGNGDDIFAVSGGFIEVQPNMVKVLADTATRAKDIDEAAAQAAVKAAEKALHEKGADFDYGSAAARLAEAAAQLRTIEQMRKKYGRH